MQQVVLVELRNVGEIQAIRNIDLSHARSHGLQTWIGASTVNRFPRHYDDLRLQWQAAVSAGERGAVERMTLYKGGADASDGNPRKIGYGIFEAPLERIIETEYSGSRGNWYDVYKLRNVAGDAIAWCESCP